MPAVSIRRLWASFAPSCPDLAPLVQEYSLRTYHGPFHLVMYKGRFGIATAGALLVCVCVRRCVCARVCVCVCCLHVVPPSQSFASLFQQIC
jgi:hypothetical protein